jgi:hypothetical protein
MIVALPVALALIVITAAIITATTLTGHGRHRLEPQRMRVQFYPDPPPVEVINASLSPFPVPDFPPPFLVADREKLATTGELRRYAYEGDLRSLNRAVTAINHQLGA